MAWITTKSGKRVNTDWFDQERQIDANKAEATEKNLEEKYKYINPYHKKDAKDNLDPSGYNNNCVMCALAFEASMRGEDVEANPFKFGYSEFIDRSRTPEKAFGYKTGDVFDVGRTKRDQVVREIELSMTEDWGNGSRAILQNETAHQKHAMNVINLNGKVFIVDAENGRHGTVAEMLKGLDTKHVKLFRTDNQSIDDDWAKWAYKRR